MEVRRLLVWIVGIACVALAIHLLWSVAVSIALARGYQHRMFDLRRWDSSIRSVAAAAATKELAARFVAARFNDAGEKARTAFIGSSFTYGYPWQEPVTLSRHYAATRQGEVVVNVSLIGATSEDISKWLLCAAHRQPGPLDVAIVEIPVVNTLASLTGAMRRHEPLRPVRPLGQCRSAGVAGGYFPFVVRRMRGLGWIRFMWDPEAYWKPDEDVRLQPVPADYFATPEAFAEIEATYREQVAQLLRNALEVSRNVYAFATPVFLPGAEEIGEDVVAIRAQLRATIEACRAVKGVRCLDTEPFYDEREYYYNVTHLNQRGHRAMGEWFARKAAAP